MRSLAWVWYLIRFEFWFRVRGHSAPLCDVTGGKILKAVWWRGTVGPDQAELSGGSERSDRVPVRDNEERRTDQRPLFDGDCVKLILWSVNGLASRYVREIKFLTIEMIKLNLSLQTPLPGVQLPTLVQAEQDLSVGPGQGQAQQALGLPGLVLEADHHHHGGRHGGRPQGQGDPQRAGGGEGSQEVPGDILIFSISSNTWVYRNICSLWSQLVPTLISVILLERRLE